MCRRALSVFSEIPHLFQHQVVKVPKQNNNELLHPEMKKKEDKSDLILQRLDEIEDSIMAKVSTPLDDFKSKLEVQNNERRDDKTL